MAYIKGRSKDTKQRYNKAFCEVEIEAYDHDLTQVFLREDLIDNASNIKSFYKYDLDFIKANNTSNWFTLTKTVNADENGEYRVLLFGLTNATYSHKLEVLINGRSLNQKSIKSLDEFVRCYDFGTIWLTEGDNSLEVSGNGESSVAIVALRKIRRFYGNSDNEGDLKIKSAEFTINGLTSEDTFKMTILSHPNFLDPNKTDYHKSGLVFEIGDVINIKMGESRRKLTHSFGGYITIPELSDNELNIEFQGVGRLSDLNKSPIVKEIIVGGATPTQSGLTYATNNLYDAIRYLVESVELPLNTNLDTILDNIAPVKYAVNVDMGLSTVNSKFVVSNMKKTIVSDKNMGKVVQLQNNSPANQDQYAVLLDTSKRIITSTPPDIVDKGVFYLQYGMGAEAEETKTVTRKVAVKNGRKTTYKTVQDKVVSDGFDIDKEFLAWVELQYSDTPTGTIKTVNIDFTSSTTSNKIGEITPYIEANGWKTGEIDVVSVLKNTDPQSHYYLRKVTLRTKTPAQALYDPDNAEANKQSYKMLFKRFGFKSGDAVIGETIKASGKSQFTLLKDVCDKLKLNAIIIPATERKNDILSFEVEGSVLCDFEIQESDNLVSKSSIKYDPTDTLKNSVIKVYKNTTGTYNATRKVDPISIGHFGTYATIDTINDTVGEYNAKYQALIDLEEGELCEWSYTAKIIGLPESARIGRLVPCIMNRSILNGIKTIKSIKVSFESEGRKVYTELGLDNLSDEIKAKKNITALRKSLLPQVDYTGGAEYEEAVEII